MAAFVFCFTFILPLQCIRARSFLDKHGVLLVFNVYLCTDLVIRLENVGDEINNSRGICMFTGENEQSPNVDCKIYL